MGVTAAPVTAKRFTMKLLLPVFCWVVALTTGAQLPEQRDSARLLLRKTVANPVVVANKDFAVHYEIINTGTSTAYDIALDDTKSRSDWYSRARSKAGCTRSQFLTLYRQEFVPRHTQAQLSPSGCSFVWLPRFCSALQWPLT